VALVAITFMLVLSALGLTGAFHAAVDNWAKQFDKSTVTFERAVSKLETIVDRVAKLETVTIVQGNNQVALETRVAKVEEVLAGTPFIMGSPKTATGTRPVAKAKPARRQTTKTSYQTRTSTPPQNQWPFI
jgi:cytochrome b